MQNGQENPFNPVAENSTANVREGLFGTADGWDVDDGPAHARYL